MSEKFEEYELEYSSVFHEAQASGDSSLIQSCEDLLKQMAVEARSLPDAKVKRNLLDQVKQRKVALQMLHQDLERQDLLGDNSVGSNGSAAQRERLLLQKNEDSLTNQNDNLDRARRTMEETEAVALEITSELESNRGKIQSAHGRVREMGGLTGRARRILISMNQRAVQQKMMVYGVGIGLVLTFAMMLYWMWR
jgi:hypothetical protein